MKSGRSFAWELTLNGSEAYPGRRSLNQASNRNFMETTGGSSSISKRDEPPLRVGSLQAFYNRSRMPIPLLPVDF